MEVEHEDFALIEAVLHSAGADYERLDRHIRRLEGSAAALGFRFSRTALEELLAGQAAQLGPGDYKVRVVLERSGALRTEAEPVAVTGGAQEVMLAEARVSSSRVLARHKTTSRALYSRHASRAKQLGLADVLFLNERDELAEAASSNVFLELNGELLTPPLSAGILPGVFRALTLETRANAAERTLTLADLESAAAIYLCNSVRGWRQVKLRPGLLRL